MSLDLHTLVEKLNPVCRKAMEKAAQRCVSQTHFNVEIEHFLLGLLDHSEADLGFLLRHYDILPENLYDELTWATESFKRGNSRTPSISVHLLDLLREAWNIASLQLEGEAINSGSVLLALLDSTSLRWLILQSVPGLKKLPTDRLKAEISELLRAGGQENGAAPVSPPSEVPEAGEAEAVSPSPPSQGPGKKGNSALDQFTVDIIEQVKQGEIDPIQGRDREIRQIMDILTRRRQNNPILTGEPGVGKTAIVEGLAIRIVAGDVPPALKNVSLRNLDMGLLQAGAGVRGEFEKRLKSVIQEVKRSPRPVILFVDEAHTLVGAGGPGGSGGDAASLLKPVLARGELRTIAATTWSEYKKYFEKDAALSRRFQVIHVNEPDEAEALEMIRGLVGTLEAHHQVTILDQAVRDAVRLSHRYLSGRRLPDKAISVLDTACARVHLAQNSLPSAVESLRYQTRQAELEQNYLRREQATGLDHGERLGELEARLSDLKAQTADLEGRWEAESDLVKAVVEKQEALQAAAEQDRAQSLREELKALKAQLAEVQGSSPLIPAFVTPEVITDLLSDWTGIPVRKMLTDEINTVLRLKPKMEKRLIGQSQALETICRRIQTFRANLDDPGKPAGVFLLVGSSGIGKTETALTLADILYGGERNMITLNMSEYQESYTVSGLKGSPPGYVGYGQGGVLTEAVRQRPYSVVLLDEVEKAHPDVLELFYQVFDKGRLEDAEGLAVDFKNTVILLTSNVGAETIVSVCADPQRVPDADTLVEMIWPELVKHFKPAFLGRLVVVPYYPLSDTVIQQIVRLKLEKIKTRLRDNHRAEFEYSDALVAAVAQRCNEVDTGARNVDHLLTHTLLPELSGEILRRMADGRGCERIYADLDREGEFVYQFNGD